MTVEMVVQTLLRNADVAKNAVTNAIRRLAGAGPSPYAEALRDAIITNKARVQPETVARLAQLIRKVLLNVGYFAATNICAILRRCSFNGR